MASVVKRKNSKFWTACYTARDGRQLKRSTKTTDKNQAIEIAIELERVERKAKQGELHWLFLRLTEVDQTQPPELLCPAIKISK